MINTLKNKYKNIFIIIIAICVALWFRGVNMIVGIIFPKDSIILGCSFIVISMIILYMDDSSLNELRYIRNAAAGTSGLSNNNE
jgi:hypothetical protein